MLMLAGIREIVIFSTPSALPVYRTVLGDLEALGIRVDFLSQEQAVGIAHALLLYRAPAGPEKLVAYKIAWRNRWTDDAQLHRLAAAMPACEYRDYISALPEMDQMEM